MATVADTINEQWGEPTIRNTVNMKLHKPDGGVTLLFPPNPDDNTDTLYTLTYDFKDGTSALKTPLYYEAGSSATVANPNLVTKGGYNIAGWQRDIDGQIFGAESIIEMTRNTKLTAQWVKVEKMARLTLEMKIISSATTP
jgi:hypothetical protein